MIRTRHLRELAAVAVLTSGLVACGPGIAPAGQPPIAVLTAQTFETARQAFNQASDRPRVVLLLSPT